MNYINLTNGIEAIEKYNLKDYRFVRIQSTACEQKRWDFILGDLDYDFLMNLALGNHVVFHDASSKKEESRAIYQGLSWVVFVLYKVWFNKDITPIVKSHVATQYFTEQYNLLSKSTLNKLKYFRKFLNTDTLHLYTYSFRTDNDGNYKYYSELLRSVASDRVFYE
jgi:hypothetical protein